MILRPFQSDCISAVQSGWGEAQRQLIVVPTGGGKTVIFSHLAAQENCTLILAHREELIEQAAAKLASATGIKAEIEKADRYASKSARVVVGSVQSLQGERLNRWSAIHFSLVVCDEAHHAVSNSWQHVLSHFSPARVLGVTATPNRGDKKELGAFFDRVAYEVSLVDLIKQGYLSPITIRAVPIKIDLSAVKSQSGDLDANDLDDALTPYLGQIAEALKTHAKGRRILAFLPLIETSKKFAAACRDAGLRAEHVDGYDTDRAEKLARFAGWEHDVLSNAMLLTEGYDDPGIDCVLVLRPTRSRPLYAQMIGRGTRVETLKTDLLILDFLWMHERHSLSRPASLVAGSDAEAAAITRLTESRASETNGGGQMDLLEAVSEAASQREGKLLAELEANGKRNAKWISAEEFALKHHQLAVAEYEPALPWEFRPLTNKQATALKRAGIDPQSVRGRGHASKLLDIHFKGQALTLASSKQQQLLRRLGHPSPETASLTEFRRYMGELKR